MLILNDGELRDKRVLPKYFDYTCTLFLPELPNGIPDSPESSAGDLFIKAEN